MREWRGKYKIQSYGAHLTRFSQHREEMFFLSLTIHFPPILLLSSYSKEITIVRYPANIYLTSHIGLMPILNICTLERCGRVEGGAMWQYPAQNCSTYTHTRIIERWKNQSVCAVNQFADKDVLVGVAHTREWVNMLDLVFIIRRRGGDRASG